MSFKMTLKIQYGGAKRTLVIEAPETYPSDYERAVAGTLQEFRNMLAIAMPAGFSEEGHF